MKQESDRELRPFEIQDLGDGKCTVFFNELISIETMQEEDAERTVYIYNTYEIEANMRDNMEQNITDGYSDWLNYAKGCERTKLSAEIRKKRNKLLTDCDYTQVEDADLTVQEKQDFKVYRQALRDIPEQEGFPYNVVFPEKP